MSKPCTWQSKQYAHLPEMSAREACDCTRCRKIYSAMVKEHNERAERIRFNEGKYVPEWRLRGL